MSDLGFKPAPNKLTHYILDYGDFILNNKKKSLKIKNLVGSVLAY